MYWWVKYETPGGDFSADVDIREYHDVLLVAQK